MFARARDYTDFYLVTAKTAIIEHFQYRLANVMFLIHLIIEPLIYLIVWTNVAESQGGEVGGYTASAFAAYYIVWTLVRQFNLSLSPFSFEWRIKNGRLGGELLRPIHPIHYDLGFFLGIKVPYVAYWLPAGILLWLVFRPDIQPTWGQLAAFPVALMLGFVVRFSIMWALGLITFWTTRVSAIFELFFTLELLLSGRLVPLSLMPEWAQGIANWLPFQWAFGFPIEVLIGRLTTEQIWQGFAAQLLWIGISFLIVNLVWKQGLKRFTAVGG